MFIFVRNIFYLCFKVRKFEGFLVVFDIYCMRGMMIVIVFGYVINFILLMNEYLWYGFFGVLLNYLVYLNFFLISELFVWLLI